MFLDRGIPNRGVPQRALRGVLRSPGMPRPRGIPGPPSADDAHVVPLPWCQSLLRTMRRLRNASNENGFTLIEAVMAMAIFAVVSTALAGVLTSSISARSNANERTDAEQIANSQLEFVRSISYANVGLTVNGNPSGVVDASGNQSAQGGPTVPAGYTVTIKIAWVDDSIPTSPATRANYKNVTVTVFRARDAKLMTQQSTQIGPRQRAPYGGINKGIVNAKVQYFYLNTPAPDVLVALNNGPSSPLADRSDSGGLLRFPALDPATGSTYYDLVIAPFSGYILLPDPTTTHFQIAAASATPVKVLEIYKPVTLTAAFENSNGTPFVGTVAFTVTSSRGSKSFTYSGTPVTVTSITNSTTGATELLVPAVYTITVTNQAAASFYTDPVSQSVPASLSDYPNDLAATGTVTADPLGSVTATVTSAGGPVSGATVTVSGGPRSIATKTATTNASGIATIGSLPAGSGYTVTATKGGQSAPNQTASVSGGTATNLTFDFPTGHLRARATWNGTAVPGATISLTGGPGSISLSGTSDAAGEVLFSDLPAGSGYTLTATKSGQTATASPTVVGGTTTTIVIGMPTVTVVGTVTWVGTNVNAATVTLAGGPMSLSTLTGTSNSSGQVTFTNVPAGGGYTLTATKNGQTTTLSGQTLATSPTTNVALPLPTGTINISAATWAGQPAGGASYTISGGPMSPQTFTGTLDASGIASVTVPAATSAYPYTVTVTKNAGTGTTTVSSLTAGSTAMVAPAMTPTKTLTITVKRNSTNLASTAVIVSITGGPNGTVGALPKWGGTYTTSAAGVLPAITVPSGAGGYTVKVYMSNCSSPTTYRSGSTTGVSSTGTTNTNVTVNFASSGAACPFSPLP